MSRDPELTYDRSARSGLIASKNHGTVQTECADTVVAGFSPQLTGRTIIIGDRDDEIAFGPPRPC